MDEKEIKQLEEESYASFIDKMMEGAPEEYRAKWIAGIYEEKRLRESRHARRQNFPLR